MGDRSHNTFLFTLVQMEEDRQHILEKEHECLKLGAVSNNKQANILYSKEIIYLNSTVALRDLTRRYTTISER